jgi:hypothetical protein
MPLFRNIGALTSIAPGATHHWEYWFGRGSEVGVAAVTPNMLLTQIHTQLVAREHGVVQIDSGIDEGGTLTHYTVQIHNNGPTWMDYNLNTGYLA